MSSDQSTPKYLGVKTSDFTGFDTFDAPEYCHYVALVCDEFTAICPVTGQPDQYVAEIGYSPRKLCVESKSMKLYLQTFRNHGEYVEALAARIATDLYAALEAHSVNVKLIQKSRGGISISAHAERSAHADRSWQIKGRADD
jgi:7-cyano-7-deazaguanine reductase